MSREDNAIRAIVLAWQAAWNTGDMSAAGRLFCEDADFVNVRGSHWHTRAEIESEHARRHQLQLNGSIFTPLKINQQRLGDDIVLVHIRWNITGDRELDGTSRPSRDGVMSWLMLRDSDGQWRIRSAHNTNIATPG